jgi:hypothetical protein
LKSLTKLRWDAQLVIEELERNKHVLSSKPEENLKRIAAQRAELDRLEEAATTEMVKEDVEYQVFAGMNLEETMVSSEATALIAADMDDTDSVEDYEERTEPQGDVPVLRAAVDGRLIHNEKLSKPSNAGRMQRS